MISKLWIDEYGNKFWRNEKGEYYRQDGPSVILSNGEEEYWANGKLHRIDGAAVVNRELSYSEWHINGENITDLVDELLSNSPFGDDVHLGVLAEYFAERNDFRLLDVIHRYLTAS